MENKLKVMTVVGTRPEIIRLARVMAKLDDSSAIDHIIVHTGQNYDYELNQIFFDDLGIRKPDFFLDAAGATATETVGQILIKIDPLLASEQPDAFLVLGDTNSCLSAYSAKRLKIPIFHLEAGNRSFDPNVPEEIGKLEIIFYEPSPRKTKWKQYLFGDKYAKIRYPIASGTAIIINHLTTYKFSVETKTKTEYKCSFWSLLG